MWMQCVATLPPSLCFAIAVATAVAFAFDVLASPLNDNDKIRISYAGRVLSVLPLLPVPPDIAVAE